METLLQNENREKGSNKVLFAAIGLAILVVGGLAVFYATRPTPEVKKQQYLEGAFFEGSPEFEAISKKIPVQNDADNTMESPTALGTITMFTRSRIRNISDKTIIALEINVSVLDQFDKVIREKKQIVVPTDKIENLPPNSDIYIQIPVEGFSKEDDRARVRWKVTAVKVQ